MQPYELPFTSLQYRFTGINLCVNACYWFSIQFDTALLYKQERERIKDLPDYKRAMDILEQQAKSLQAATSSAPDTTAQRGFVLNSKNAVTSDNVRKYDESNSYLSRSLYTYSKRF